MEHSGADQELVPLGLERGVDLGPVLRLDLGPKLGHHLLAEQRAGEPAEGLVRQRARQRVGLGVQLPELLEGGGAGVV